MGKSEQSFCHYLERSLALALWASAWLGLGVLLLHEGPHNVRALVAVVLDDGELRKDPGGGGDHAAGTDQLVEVELPEGPELLD